MKTRVRLHETSTIVSHALRLIALAIVSASAFADDPPPPPTSCDPGQVPYHVVGAVETWGCFEPEINYPIDSYEPPTAIGDGGHYTGTPGYFPNENLERGVDSDGFDGGECMAGNPVKIASGNKYHAERDFIGIGQLPLTIERHYNSLNANLATSKGAFGQGWSTNFLERIIAIDLADPNDRKVLIETASGLRVSLTSTNGGPWLRSNGKEVAFFYDEANDAFLWIQDGLRKTYLADGEIYQIRHSSGETLTYVYSETATMSNGSLRLDKLVHSSGQELRFVWDTFDRITKIIDPAGLEYRYWYGANGNLTTVEYPIPGGQLGSITYLYEYTTDPNKNALTGIKYSPSTQKYANYVYDTSGRATRTEHFAGAEREDIAYTSSTAYQLVRKTTNALGKQTDYTFQLKAERMRATSVAGIANGTCLAANQSYTYDAAGFYDTVTDWEGNVTKYQHNEFGQRTSITTGHGTTEARTTAFEWHPFWDQPTLINQPLLDTEIVYDDGSGLILSVTQTNKATYGSTLPRTTTFTYEFYTGGTMKKLTVDGPRTDVSDSTTYNYDTSGRLTSIVNALAHQTLFSNFDAYGRPRRIEFPSGLIRDFTYHPNGSVLTVADQVGTVWRTTAYEYYANGDLSKVTRPDGSALRYFYDNARRLNAILDDNDRHLNIDYDIASNIKRTEIWRDEYTWVQVPIDPECDPYTPPFPECQMTGSFQWVDTIVKYTDHEYDALSRLKKITQGNLEVDQYTYDKNDQLKTTLDGYNKSTILQYNAQGQVDDTTYRDGGVSKVTYDANGNISGIRDALGKWTDYQRDGFGQAWKVISPATLTTDYQYDSAGNLKQKTNANAITTLYVYDALNRVSSVKAGTMALELFQYDINRVGFLYQVTDAAGIHTFVRNAAGEILTTTSTLSGISPLVTAYTYNSMGRVDTMTYPSGLNVKYYFDALGQVERIETWSTGLSLRNVVSEVTHYPWGPIDDYKFGNDELRTTRRDKLYRLSLLSSGNAIASQTYLYDSNSNVKQISVGTRTYTYDAMDRLNAHTGPDGSYEYNYDLNGNRNWHKKAGVQTNYVYDTNRTRLLSRNGGIAETRTYDAMSNTKKIGSQEFIYNHKDRVSRYKYGGVNTDYTYNAFGARMVKKHGTTTTRYVYDGPSLLHEQTGSVKRDYIYLQGEVVGAVINNTLYYVHNDHLGRPQAITNLSQQKVWEAENNAFGSLPILDAINGFNIGFPGQYYDSESATWYNYFRTYDASSGRYLQSDPIGLSGGSNSHTYAASNPLAFIDPFGLDTLIFDGKDLSQLDDDGNIVQTWPAVSGRPGTSRSDMYSRNIGPIPEGDYSIDPAQTNKDGFWKIGWGNPIAWGKVRTEIEPKNETFTNGRDEMYVHGGLFPGSAGCIDLTSSNDDFHDWLKSLEKPIDLKVEYPRPVLESLESSAAD